MRKLLTFALVLAMAALGAPVGVFAQSAAQATISGETVDAGGRALAGQRVELVRNSEVIANATSGNRGEWTFANVAPGDYIVRTTINGQVAGARVSVVAGQMIARALIVAPSAAAPSAQLIGGLTPLFIGGIVIGGGLIIGIVAWNHFHNSGS